jgi:hypothetical protein
VIQSLVGRWSNRSRQLHPAVHPQVSDGLFRKIGGKDAEVDRLIRENMGRLREIWEHTVHYCGDAEQNFGRAFTGDGFTPDRFVQQATRCRSPWKTTSRITSSRQGRAGRVSRHCIDERSPRIPMTAPALPARKMTEDGGTDVPRVPHAGLVRHAAAGQSPAEVMVLLAGLVGERPAMPARRCRTLSPPRQAGTRRSAAKQVSENARQVV